MDIIQLKDVLRKALSQHIDIVLIKNIFNNERGVLRIKKSTFVGTKVALTKDNRLYITNYNPTPNLPIISTIGGLMKSNESTELTTEIKKLLRSETTLEII